MEIIAGGSSGRPSAEPNKQTKQALCPVISPAIQSPSNRNAETQLLIHARIFDTAPGLGLQKQKVPIKCIEDHNKPNGK